MATALTQALSAAVLKLLRPLVRILLRNGVPFGTFADLARRVYVDVAMKEFAIAGRKQSVSRVSVITGLTRKEVTRISNLPQLDDAGESQRYNRAARVISGWVRDPRYADGAGEPAALRMTGSGATFSELVKRFSGDIPARAILDELVRVGAVKRLKNNRVRLESRAYNPRTGELEKLGILGVDVADLISTIDHNLQTNGRKPFFQRKVSYDHLPVEVMARLRRLSAEKSQGLLEDLDRWMSDHDRDVTPSTGGTGRKRVAIGIYYWEEDFPEEGR